MQNTDTLLWDSQSVDLSCQTGDSGAADLEDELSMGDPTAPENQSSIMLLPFAPQWYITIIILILIDAFDLVYLLVFFRKGDELEFTNHVNHLVRVMILIDIVLVLIYKKVDRFNLSQVHNTPHYFLLAIDFISILPLREVYVAISRTNMNTNVYVFLSLVNLLRINRMFWHFHLRRQAVGKNNVIDRILEFLAIITVTSMSIAVILYSITKHTPNWLETLKKSWDIEPKTGLDWFVICYHVACTLMTLKGCNFGITESNMECTIFAAIVFSSFIYLSGFYLSHFTIAKMQDLRTKYAYFTKLAKLKDNMKILKVSPKVYNRAVNYYETLWKTMEGIVDRREIEMVVPLVMEKEMSLDILWDAFRHSHLFQNQEIPFLRSVGLLLEKRLFLPGEYIFTAGVLKQRMVYIVSGVIQIISEEDGTTPIMSLSGGTCIGETSLILPYKATRSVCCKSYCVAFVLEAEKFVKVIKEYPYIYRSLQSSIRRRYKIARAHEELTRDIDPQDENAFSRGVLTLRWVKSTVQNFLHSRHSQKQKLLDDQQAEMESFERLLFMADNLDMVVTSEQFELVTDTVFLRSGCPCILQPDSVLIICWKRIILIMAMLTAVIVPYYASFATVIPKWYNPFIYSVTVLWCLDVYLTASTAFHTRDEILVFVREILFKRLGEFTFCVDIFAACPCELLGIIFMVNPSAKRLVIMQLNRVLKMWFLEYQLQSLEQSMTLTSVQVRALKYILYTFFSIYLSAVILYIYFCTDFDCHTLGWHDLTSKQLIFSQDLHSTIVYTFFTTQIMTGSALNDIFFVGNGRLIAHILLMILATIISIYLVGGLAAVLTLQSSNWGETYLLTLDVKRTGANMKLSKEMLKRLWMFMDCQWQFNEGTFLHTQAEFLKGATWVVYRDIKVDAFARIIRTIPVFEGWSDEIINDLSTVVTCHVIPANEVIVYAGSVCPDMHINYNGYCLVMSSSVRLEPTLLPPPSSFAVLEMFSQMLNVHTIIAYTCCELMSLSRQNFIKVMSRYPEEYKEFMAIVDSMQPEIQEYSRRESLQYNIYEHLHETKQMSFCHFDFEQGSEEETVFDLPFARLRYFQFIKYLLLGITFYPTGKFLIYWEISRCIFAVLSGFLFCIPPFIVAPIGSFWWTMLLFLDLTAYVDIYVQMHVCFFNKDGILVTHPLETATHYLTHRFPMDLLGCFKFDLFVNMQKDAPQLYTQLANVNRILQCFRLHGCLDFNKELLMENSILVHLLGCGLFQILIINVLACLTTTARCWFGPHITQKSRLFTAGVRCDLDSWYAHSHFQTPLSPLRVYLYGLYYTASICTGTGVQGFIIGRDVQAFQAILLAVLGYFFNAFMIASLISISTIRNRALPFYQAKMQALIKYMDSKIIPVAVRRETTKYFELLWYRKRGKDIDQLFSNFHDMLREDILYDSCGKVLQNSSVFEKAEPAFLRHLLLHVRVQLIMNTGSIVRINDINPYLYILYSGTAQVFGPAGARFSTLYAGSIFGNIDDVVSIRQAITVVALGHVEVLKIPAPKFHEILQSFPRFKYVYEKNTALNYDFLANTNVKEEETVTTVNAKDKYFGEHETMAKLHKAFIHDKQVLHPDWLFMRIWNGWLLYTACYFTFFIEMYQIGVNDYSTPFIIMQYSVDGFFLLNILMKFITAYEDAFGVLITSKKKIALNYIHRYDFKIDVVTNMPIELLAFLAPGRDFAILVGWLRLNRCIRIVYVIAYFRTVNVTLNINMLHMQVTYAIVWVTLILHATICFALAFACLDKKSISANLSCISTKDSTTSYQKGTVYIYHMYAIVSIFCSNAIGNYYPNSPIMIIYFVMLMITGHLMEIKFVAEICSAIDMDHSCKNTYDRKILLLHGYMHHSSLSPALFERAWSYVKRLWLRQRGVQYPEILDEAPCYMKEQILYGLYGQYFESSPLFCYCHVDFVRQIVSHLKVMTYFPGDYICFEGDVHQTLYVVHRGEVEKLVEGSLYIEQVRTNLYIGSMFGLQPGLHPGTRYMFTYRAVKTSVILSLYYPEWCYLLGYFPASKQEMYKQAEILRTFC